MKPMPPKLGQGVAYKAAPMGGYPAPKVAGGRSLMASNNDGEPLWVQLDTLRPGDQLSIHTESKVYDFIFVGQRAAMMVSVNPDVPSGLVALHGTYPSDPDSGSILWGTMQVGAYALFAPLGNPTEGIKTSKVTKLVIIRANLRNSAYAGVVSGAPPAASVPAKPSVAAPGVKTPALSSSLRPTGSPPVVSPRPLLGSVLPPKVVSPPLPKPKPPVMGGIVGVGEVGRDGAPGVLVSSQVSLGGSVKPVVQAPKPTPKPSEFRKL